MKKVFLLCAVMFLGGLLYSEELPKKESNWAKGPNSDWYIHFDEAKEKAESSGKNILVLKMESDGAPACAKMQKEVLSKSKFRSMAKNRYILLWIDLPKKKQLSPNQLKHNNAVVKNLKLAGAPQMKVVNTDGVEIGTLSGYTKDKAVYSFLKKTSQKNSPLKKRSSDSE